MTHGTGSNTGLVQMACPFGSDCYYVGEGVEWHGLDPLTSSETNGSLTLTGQKVTEEPDVFFCPENGPLDITAMPLSATHISE